MPQTALADGLRAARIANRRRIRYIDRPPQPQRTCARSRSAMGDKRSAARPRPNQGGCLLVAALVLMACLYANNPAVQDADDGIALRLARVAELDVEVQGHAALRDAARSDVALARAQAEHIEAAPEPPPPPPRQQRREVLTTKPEAQQDYRGYTFWSSDFHISPIADLKDLFAPMGMRIIDESLSGHCHLKKTCSRNLKVITKQNGITLGQCPNQLRRKFFEAYVNDARMKSADAFLCHHAAGLCEAFMPFNKSLVVVASTRYEIGRHDPRRWKAWNANLKAIAAHPRNVVAANNRYDAEYVKYFTGLSHVPVLPNYCGWRCGNQPRVDGVASPRRRAGAGRPTCDVPPTSRRWRQRDVTPSRRRRRGRRRVYASRERAAAASLGFTKFRHRWLHRRDLQSYKKTSTHRPGPRRQGPLRPAAR